MRDKQVLTVIYGTVNTFSPPAARKLLVGLQKNNSRDQFTLEGSDSTGGTSPPVAAGQLYLFSCEFNTGEVSSYPLNPSTGVSGNPIVPSVTAAGVFRRVATLSP